LTEYPHVKARLKRVTEAPGASMARWRIRIDGAVNAQEIQEINRWAHAANILPHMESHAE
jgi:pentose-5-phosphate-3-epimerase